MLKSRLDPQKTPEEIGELIDSLGKLIDRTKVMYEQFFMGIQKMPPSQLHRDIERRIREITQLQIRNTGLRFRFATLTQKFGSYNTYWKRTMRKIERGEYIRDIAKVGRRAAARGEQVPAELLAKVPKRMRDRIMRDRKRVADREAAKQANSAAEVAEGKVRTPKSNTHVLQDDFDMESIFASLVDETPGASAARDDADTGEFAAPGSYAQTRNDITPAPPAQPSSPSLPDRPPPHERPRSAARIRKPAPTQKQPRAAHPRTVSRAQTNAGGQRVAPPTGMSESEGRALYDQYSKARKLVGDRRPVSYDQLMNKLSKQAPKIMKDHKASGVGFSVVIKGDKVVLKAKPKKG